MDVRQGIAICTIRPTSTVGLLVVRRSAYLFLPRIVSKLQTEANAHLGPGGPANAKKGTVDVKRGGMSFLHIGFCIRIIHHHVHCRLLPVCLFPSKDGTSLSSDQGMWPLPTLISISVANRNYSPDENIWCRASSN